MGAAASAASTGALGNVGSFASAASTAASTAWYAPPQSKALPGFEGVNIDTVRGLRRVGEATRQA